MTDERLVALLRIVVLLMVAAGATATVRTREPTSQAVAVGFYGLLLAAMFFLFQAPDVALSQIVVGAVALPLMILLALARIRRNDDQRRRGEERSR